MTPDELAKKLAEAGIKTGTWQKGGGKSVKSPIIERQRDLMGKLADLLEEQVEKDLQTVALLQEKMAHLKHGGGR